MKTIEEVLYKLTDEIDLDEPIKVSRLLAILNYINSIDYDASISFDHRCGGVYVRYHPQTKDN